MKNYYDPMLFASTPEHPGIAGAVVVLKEDIDEMILQKAVERLRDRFPYFYVRPAIEDGDLTAVPNPLPVTVRNSREPTLLMSKEVNYHMLALRYEGAAFTLEISHLLTDGAGLIPYLKSILYCYLSMKTGKKFDPEGFKLPGQPIPETEIGDPFPGLDLKSAKPFYKKKSIREFYRFKKNNKDGKDIKKTFFLKIPEEGLMQVCKENDGTPNVLLSVLLARAIRRIDPESQKTILGAIAINHKALLGNYDNYRLFADTANIDFRKQYASDDLTRMCTIVRGQLMLQAQPENSAAHIKEMKNSSQIIGRLPLSVRRELIKKLMDSPRATYGVSYPGRGNFGPLDPYIKELYYLAEADVCDVVTETACLNHTFFLNFTQSFSSEEYLEAFIKEANEVGLTVEVTGKESRNILSGVRFDDVPGMKSMSESIKEGLSEANKMAGEMITNAGNVLKKVFSSPL